MRQPLFFCGSATRKKPIEQNFHAITNKEWCIIMKKMGYWLFPLVWMSGIFYASSQPYEEQDLKPVLSGYFDLSFLRPYLDGISFHYHNSEVSIARLGTEGFIEFFIRKGAHVGVYFVLVLLLFLAFRKTTLWRTGLVLVLSYFITVLYAVSDEFHQALTPNRTPYAGDVVLDSIGALIGIFLIWRVFYSGLYCERTGKHSNEDSNQR